MATAKEEAAVAQALSRLLATPSGRYFDGINYTDPVALENAIRYGFAFSLLAEVTNLTMPTSPVQVTLAPGTTLTIADLIALKPVAWAGAEVTSLTIIEARGGDAQVTLPSGVVAIGPGAYPAIAAPWSFMADPGGRVENISVAAPALVTVLVAATLRKA